MPKSALVPSDLRGFVDLDRKIDRNDQAALKNVEVALRRRWEFGQLLLARREGSGRLPNGFMAHLVQSTGKSKTELSYRMQFAEKYPNEDKLSDALDTFTAWRQVTQSLGRSGDTAKHSKEWQAASRLTNVVELLLAQAEANSVAPGDQDFVRRALEGAQKDIPKVLSLMDASEASRASHPAGTRTPKSQATPAA